MKRKPGNSQAHPIVAIVGGGASGVLVAIRLLGTDAAKAGKFRVVLFEKSTQIGKGLAYGSAAPFHALNVRQDRMSVFEEDEGHFSRWIGRYHPADLKIAYQPRRSYGEYLASSLAEATNGVSSPTFKQVKEEITGYERKDADEILLRTASGKSYPCNRLVLATGYGKPIIPKVLQGISASAHFHADPWSERAGKIGHQARIFVLGAGLTAVDFVIAQMRRGHRSPIDLLSRHGLVPHGHPVEIGKFDMNAPFPDESLRGVVRELRRLAEVAGERWPALVDRFRSEVNRIWVNWSDRERLRFQRHVRPYWDIHRHRFAPEVFREWDLYRRGGKVRVDAGRIESASEAGDGIRIRFKLRGGDSVERIYDEVVNCSGAPMDRSLLVPHGYASDPMGIGVPTDRYGRPLNSAGKVENGIFVFGPLLRTHYWEMIAIPDLRVQAKLLADEVVASVS